MPRCSVADDWTEQARIASSRPERGEVPTASNKRLAEAYNEHFESLSRYALLLANGQQANAEDLVHEAFLGLLRASRAVTWPKDPRAYLFGALIRKDRARRRDAQRRGPEFWMAYAGLLQAKAPPPAGSELDDAERICRALEKLPAEQREVVLRVQAGLSFAEIAQALEVPQTTARSRYQTALEQLRGALK